MPQKKLADHEVKPRSSAHRYRYTKRKKPLMVYFSDEEFEALQKLAQKFQTNKSALVRNSLNLYSSEFLICHLIESLNQAKNNPEIFTGTFAPY